jgi:polysaccharide export outer membrane protein
MHKSAFCLPLCGLLAVQSLLLLVPARCRAQSSSTASADVAASLEQAKGSVSRREAMGGAAGVTAIPEGFEALTLLPGDLLRMDIYDVPEMSTNLRVDSSGNVAIPLAGDVHIEGYSLPDAKNAIAKELVDKDILNSPQVSLDIVQYSAHSINVMGEVQSPGRIQLLAPRDLADILSLAGGEGAAAGSDIEIDHDGGNGKTAANHVHYVPGASTTELHSVEVSPGDTVFVHRAGIVYVLGAVNRPGGFLMVDHASMTLTQAISLAYGTSQVASLSKTMILRRQGDREVVIEVPLHKIEQGKQGEIVLEDHDIVFVQTSKLKFTFTTSTSVLAAAASASIYKF